MTTATFVRKVSTIKELRY